MGLADPYRLRPVRGLPSPPCGGLIACMRSERVALDEKQHRCFAWKAATPPRDTAWAMSEENVEVIRAVFEAWNAGDMDAVRETHDPDVILRTVADWPEQGPYLDREAVMRFMNNSATPGTRTRWKRTATSSTLPTESLSELPCTASDTALRRIWNTRSSTASVRARSARLSTSGTTRTPSKPPGCRSRRCRRRMWRRSRRCSNRLMMSEIDRLDWKAKRSRDLAERDYSPRLRAEDGVAGIGTVQALLQGLGRSDRLLQGMDFVAVQRNTA